MNPKLPHADCANCPAKGGKMLPSRPATAGRTRLVILGEKPCESDVREGAVFRSGGARHLARELHHAGIRWGEVHLMNAVACTCSNKDLAAARKACAPRVAAELQELEAASGGGLVVAALGAEATQSAIGVGRKTPILKWRGSVVEVNVGAAAASGARGSTPPSREDVPDAAAIEATPRPRLVLPLIHPAEARRTPKWGSVFAVDCERVGRIVRLRESGEAWRPPEELEGRKLLIPQTEGAVRDALQRLGPEVVLDVETVGLGPTRTLLVCLGLSDGDTTVVIPWSSASNGIECWWGDAGGKRVAAMINAALASRRVITHNGPGFDFIVCARYGILAPRWDDTLIASHSTEGHLPKNLAFLVTRLGVDVGPWKMQEDRGADLERLWVYNGRDCLYTMLAWRVMRDRVAHDASARSAV